MRNLLHYFLFIGCICQCLITYPQQSSGDAAEDLLQKWSAAFQHPLAYDKASADWLFRKAKAEIVSQVSQSIPLMISDEELEQRQENAIQHLQVAIEIYQSKQSKTSLVHAKRYYITACQRWKRPKSLYRPYMEDIEDYGFYLVRFHERKFKFYH